MLRGATACLSLLRLDQDINAVGQRMCRNRSDKLECGVKERLTLNVKLLHGIVVLLVGHDCVCRYGELDEAAAVCACGCDGVDRCFST